MERVNTLKSDSGVASTSSLTKDKFVLVGDLSKTISELQGVLAQEAKLNSPGEEAQVRIRLLEEKLKEKQELVQSKERELEDFRSQLVAIRKEAEQYMNEERVGSKHHMQYKRLSVHAQEPDIQTPTEESTSLSPSPPLTTLPQPQPSTTFPPPPTSTTLPQPQPSTTLPQPPPSTTLPPVVQQGNRGARPRSSTKPSLPQRLNFKGQSNPSFPT